jgi:hypothetical protein
MSEFFGSIRADLTDRRLLPVVALVGVCLIAALAYAVLGGSGGSAAPTAAAPATVTPPSGGISVNAATPEQAVAETTDGVKEQNGGKARDPFSPLAGSASTTTAAVPTSAATPVSSSGSAGAGGSTITTPETSGAAEPPAEVKGGTGGQGKSKSKKAKTVYDVAVEFGELPAGTTPEAAQLTPFTKLKLQTPLPSAELPLLVFRGVTAKGSSATFTLVGEAILSGTGACLPSATQCEAVDLKPGETEQLSYLAGSGQTVVYELRVIGITAEKAKASSAKAAAWAESKAGRELLRKNGLVTLPFLRYSSQPGVLVFAPRKAAAARAHTAVITSVG